MSPRNISVDHCSVEVLPQRRGVGTSEAFRESATFYYGWSECHIRLSYGWEGNDRKLKINLKTSPTLCEEFYATVLLVKEKQTVSYPNKLIRDTNPNKCILSTSLSVIAEQIPDFDIWNCIFRITLQKEIERNYDVKNSGNKFVQTVSGSPSLERLSKDFSRLLDMEHGQDVKLKCGSVVRKANKSILIARSGWFENKFQTSAEDVVEVPLMDPAVFNEIIRYIYSARDPDLTHEMAENLYKAADLLDIGSLKEQCAEYLMENLSIDNACDYLTFANDYFKDKIVGYIMKKDIVYLDGYWYPFCDQYPKLANEVLNKLCRLKRL